MKHFNHISAAGRIELWRLVMMFLLPLVSMPASAVTDQEMEQARTITAQTYLRYANDGSGYLDDLHPVTMAALQKSLKEKERENLKAFQAVPVPKDYASWDKDKLVEYWSVTFFRSPGLSEKGKIGKTRVKSRLLRMNVAPPAGKNEPAKEEPKKEEPARPEADASQAPAVPAELVQPADSRADSLKRAEESGAAAQAGRLKEMEAKADSLEALDEEAAGDEPVRRRQDSTWLYIVILCVLVAIVVVLVFFASSTIRKDDRRAYSAETPEGRNRRRQLESEIRAEEAERTAQLEARQAKALDKARSETAAANTAAEAAIAAADMERARTGEALREVDNLRKRMLSAEQEALALRTERDALAEKVRILEETLRDIANKPSEPAPSSPAPQASGPNGQASNTTPGASVTDKTAPRPERPSGVGSSQAVAASAAEGHTEVRKSKIYLGRVNNRGLFVRADRGLNPEGSVYVLETEDGYSGSFRVVRNREVWARILNDPAYWLDGGCIMRDEDTDKDSAAIHTESPGTAIFENSCWRVIRKAKIRFE